MLQIKGKTVRERFLGAVDSLEMKFPGATIAKKTGYNKGTVSAYLKNLDPSEAFIKTFCQQFDFDFDLIWRGKSEEHADTAESLAAEPSPMQILSVLADAFKDQAKAFADQAAIMKSIESKMAQEETQAIIKNKVEENESNLNEALAILEKLSLIQNRTVEKIVGEFAALRGEIGSLQAVSRRKA